MPNGTNYGFDGKTPQHPAVFVHIRRRIPPRFLRIHRNRSSAPHALLSEGNNVLYIMAQSNTTPDAVFTQPGFHVRRFKKFSGANSEAVCHRTHTWHPQVNTTNYGQSVDPSTDCGRLRAAMRSGSKAWTLMEGEVNQRMMGQMQPQCLVTARPRFHPHLRRKPVLYAVFKWLLEKNGPRLQHARPGFHTDGHRICNNEQYHSHQPCHCVLTWGGGGGRLRTRGAND